jgi:DNA polymerase IV
MEAYCVKCKAKKVILHIDMNSYFASVEQQANPFLRGRPVGVCSYLSPGGCIIASSMEAKAKGIKTGCRVSDARMLDPDVVLLENEPSKYRSATDKIFGILKEYTDTFEPYSIDEAFLDLTGWVRDFPAAESLGRDIQCRIKAEIGEWLNSSVGIGWTRFLAKFAGDIAPKKACSRSIRRPSWGDCL